ncbi:MAG: hypothetical protein QXL17_07140 [Candidatus Thermoplasmatota archaeon]
MRTQKIVGREAGVLLIAVVLLFSATSVIATTETTNHHVLLTDGSGSNTKVISTQITNAQNVLWDNGLPDEMNGVSCVYWAANPIDREVVDDFDITDSAWNIDGGSFRIVTYAGTGSASVLGVNVFFYQDDGTNKPKLTPFVSPTATFTASDTGNMYFGRPEILIQVSFAAVELTTGKWWVCFQPVLNDNGFWLTAPLKTQSIWVDYPDLGYSRWTKGSVVFSGAEYGVSFTLTGTAGPQPELEITSIKTGIGLRAILKNTGDADATQVSWSITANGGLVFPKQKNGVISTLASGDTTTIKMIVLGFGPTVFTITATCDEGAEVEANQSGFVLFFFVFGM